jgi:hypothetical protein
LLVPPPTILTAWSVAGRTNFKILFSFSHLCQVNNRCWRVR